MLSPAELLANKASAYRPAWPVLSSIQLLDALSRGKQVPHHRAYQVQGDRHLPHLGPAAVLQDVAWGGGEGQGQAGKDRQAGLVQGVWAR